MSKHAYVRAGNILKRARQRTGLNQEQVIRLAGIPTTTQLSEFENGKVNVGRSKYFPALASAIGLTEQEICEINPAAVFSQPRTTPLLYEEKPELAKMIEERASIAPELRTARWREFLAGHRWSAGVTVDAERWWQLFISLQRLGVEPS